MKTDKVECEKDEQKQKSIYPVFSGFEMNRVVKSLNVELSTRFKNVLAMPFPNILMVILMVMSP